MCIVSQSNLYFQMISEEDKIHYIHNEAFV